MVSKAQDDEKITDGGKHVPSSLLTCHDLACNRGGRRIFEGLGFSLSAGGLLIIKGANGSGKTSLIKILAGLMPGEKGEISWNGVSIKDNAAYDSSRLYIGHKDGLKLECTIRENLNFWASISGTDTLLPAAMHYWGLTRKQHLPCAALSSGWRRKVALARLVLSPMSVWLLDEPTNFLDAQAVELFAALVESRVQQGGIAIIASHTVHSAFGCHTFRMEDFFPC